MNEILNLALQTDNQFLFFIILYVFNSYSENIGEVLPVLRPFLPHSRMLKRLDKLEDAVNKLGEAVEHLSAK